MLSPSEAFVPVSLRAVKIRPDQPLVFDFIVDIGNAKLSQEEIKSETQKLAKYFLATLTIPEKDLWVNLSPYEKDHIIPDEFGLTEMGKDLLAQDYILKQLTASMMYPGNDLGMAFWDRVYAKTKEALGTIEIPMNTFNKVWIVPDKAVVYEMDNTAIVGEAHLKVMMEEDYLALEKNNNNPSLGMDQLTDSEVGQSNQVTSQAVRDIILPEIEKEVNQGKNFALLRQVYAALILATWYKQNLKDSLLAQVYADQKKIKGVDVLDKNSKEQIYQQYIAAYKAGVFNFIKEDVDPETQETFPRRYFSGGADFAMMRQKVTDSKIKVTNPEQQIPREYKVSQVPEGPGLFQAEIAAVRPVAVPPEIRVGTIDFAQNDLMRQSNFEFLRANRQRLVNITEVMQSGGSKDDRETALTNVYNEARVNIPGPVENRPALFTVRASKAFPQPKPQMGVDDILREVGRFMPITEEEALKLKDKTPFEFSNDPQVMERSGKLYLAALKSGVLGKQYFVTNIKRMSPEAFVNYLEFLQDITDQFHGNVEILLSVEESGDVLKGDGAGMTSAIEAITSVLGENFVKNANLNIITDGGTKDRGGNETGLKLYNGMMQTAFGVPYYMRAIETIGITRLQQKRFGEGRVVWTASDGDYDIGKIMVGQRPLSTLENDGTWGMILHGAGEELFSSAEQPTVFQQLEEANSEVNAQGEKIAFDNNGLLKEEFKPKYLALSKAIDKIVAKKLDQLGEHFIFPDTGKEKVFFEKPTPRLMLDTLKELGANSVIPNAFLAIYPVDDFLKQQEAYRAEISPGHYLREVGGSYFQQLIQAQFNPGAIAKLPPGTQAAIVGVQKVFPAKEGKILVASVARFTDRGKTQFLTDAYWDYIDARKKEGKSGIIQEGIVSIKGKVKLNIPQGATAILQNVEIIGPESGPEVELNLADMTFLQDSRIVLEHGLTFHPKTLITESDIDIPIVVSSGDVSLKGIRARAGEELLDMTATGQWERARELVLYPGETVVTMLTRDGDRYLNRTLTGADYKGATLSDIAKTLKVSSATNPRLLGVPAIAVPELELINMKNWYSREGNVSIASAKNNADYVAMSRGFRQLKQDLARAQDSAMKNPGGIDFDPGLLNLKVERTGDKVQVTVDPAELQRIKTEGVDGFQPVIINIVPVKAMLPALGLSEAPVQAEPAGAAT